MSRDYKHSGQRGGSRAGTLFAGVFIGLVVGLGTALAVVWYLNFHANPFDDKAAAQARPAPAKSPGPPADQAAAVPPVAEAKPRFDFYTILPGVEEPVTPKDARQRAEEGKVPTVPERLFLQAGAFQNADDADNLRARLALLGLEAAIQTVSLPDKGVWHRVRLGPYGNLEEAEQIRVVLAQNSIAAVAIRIRDKPPAAPVAPGSSAPAR